MPELKLQPADGIGVYDSDGLLGDVCQDAEEAQQHCYAVADKDRAAGAPARMFVLWPVVVIPAPAMDTPQDCEDRLTAIAAFLASEIRRAMPNAKPHQLTERCLTAAAVGASKTFGGMKVKEHAAALLVAIEHYVEDFDPITAIAIREGIILTLQERSKISGSRN